LGDEIDQAAWWAGIFDDLDAVLEFDALDDLGQLIFAPSIVATFSQRHWPLAALWSSWLLWLGTHVTALCENFFWPTVGHGRVTKQNWNVFCPRRNHLHANVRVWVERTAPQQATNGLHAMLM
jgi:hypothetical protein